MHPTQTTPAAIERVFGRSRLKMVTGQYVDVHREQAAPGERRRYTKRFLSTLDGDFRAWTEREWRLLARLVGHGVRAVPQVVQYDRGSADSVGLVQTYDAGVTIDHWQTLLPVQRDGQVLRHVFQDCAHWWALARHVLLALHEIHRLQLVHLDLKADNVCIPLWPGDFDPDVPGQVLKPDFEQLALIDFAFSLVTGEAVSQPLPIGWQREFPYQSPRLLQALVAGRNGDLEPTRRLDWRCDMYSVAAMLKRYLPAPERVRAAGDHADGWTDDRFLQAKVLILQLNDCHDREATDTLPHQALVDACGVQLQQADLSASLDLGWTLAGDGTAVDAMAPTVLLTPVTLIEQPTRVATTVLEVAPISVEATRPPPGDGRVREPVDAPRRQPARRWIAVVPLALAAVAAWWMFERTPAPVSRPDDAIARTAPPAARVPDTVSPQPDLVVVQRTATAPESRLPVLPPPREEVLPPPREEFLPPTRRVAPPDRPPAVAESARQQPAPVLESSNAPPQDALARRADDILRNALPALGEAAAAGLAPVLGAAGSADTPAQDRALLRTAHALRPATSLGPLTDGTDRTRARQLNSQARDAFWTRADIAGALALQTRAFGADPLDAEIAGNLSFYHLKAQPARPETARQLALHALQARTAESGSTRLEDWGNLAVASALTGRPQDATNAMLVFLAASKDVNRACRSALSAVASYGPRLKAPVEAMLMRVQERGAAADAPHCAWPPRWEAGSRFP